MKPRMHHPVNTVSPYARSVWKGALVDIKSHLSSNHIHDWFAGLQIISSQREYLIYYQQLGNPDSVQ